MEHDGDVLLHMNQSLNLFEINKQTSRTLFKTYIPNRFHDEYKCDLHPRVNYNNKMISVDLVHKNKRAMGIINI